MQAAETKRRQELIHDLCGGTQLEGILSSLHVSICILAHTSVTLEVAQCSDAEGLSSFAGSLVGDGRCAQEQSFHFFHACFLNLFMERRCMWHVHRSHQRALGRGGTWRTGTFSLKYAIKLLGLCIPPISCCVCPLMDPTTPRRRTRVQCSTCDCPW